MKEYKGMRVIKPLEHNMYSHILDSWLNSAKIFGFRQYKTSVLDNFSIYEGKSSREILESQTYLFKDKSDRSILLRPEITPGTALMVSEIKDSNSLHSPLKIFTIGSVFRYESSQKGRKREHVQFNADIFGIEEDNIWSVIEIIDLAMSSLIKIGFDKQDFIIKINDRKILKKCLNTLNITNEEEEKKVLSLLDKRDKLTNLEIDNELKSISNSLSLSEIDKSANHMTRRIKMVIEKLSKYDYDIEFDSNIVRGFDYYTGVIFEVYAKDSSIKRSIIGGGEYDNLVENYTENNEKVRAVGFGMGDVILLDLLEEFNLPIDLKYKDSIAVYALEDEYVNEAQDLARSLRKSYFGDSFLFKIICFFNKIKGNKYFEIHFNGIIRKKVDKLYTYLETQNVKMVIIVGETIKYKKIATSKSLIIEREKVNFTTINNFLFK